MIPKPERKPSQALPTNGGIIDNIFDTVKNGFQSLAQFEIDRYQARRIAELREIESGGAEQRVSDLAGDNFPETRNNGLNTTVIAVSALLGVTALVIALR